MPDQTPEVKDKNQPEGAGQQQRPPLRDPARLNRTVLLCIIALMAGYFLSGRLGKALGKQGAAERNFETMNTFGRILVPEGSGSDMEPEELAKLAEEAVRQINTLMSPFGEGSDVRRLNAAKANEWVEVHPLTWNVVMEALRWHRLSGGAFDPTIGPIKRLFTFDQREVERLPDAHVMAEAKSRIGGDKLQFEREGMRLAWTKDGMQLDLGAIAKGYAADRAAEVLLKHGVTNALVDIGGELRVLGSRPGNPPRPWRAGIQNPRGTDAVERLELENVGVATSGDYERFFMHNGKRYEHIIDPRKGMPLTEGVAAVTAIHPSSCLAADALATTMTVLGVDEGKKFLESQALGLFSQGVRIILLEVLPEGALRRVEYVVNTDGTVTTDDSRLEAGQTR